MMKISNNYTTLTGNIYNKDIKYKKALNDISAFAFEQALKAGFNKNSSFESRFYHDTLAQHISYLVKNTLVQH